MTRRMTRRVPLVSGMQPVIRSLAASTRAAQTPAGFRQRRTYIAPQPLYTGRASAPIGGTGYGSAVVKNATATVAVGPAGIGTVWYPTMAVIATTTGATDSSTCTLYLGPLGNGNLTVQTQIGGQSYTGGGDTIGLSIPPVFPGYFITAVWLTATNGDLATLTIYGDQQALVT